VLKCFAVNKIVLTLSCASNEASTEKLKTMKEIKIRYHIYASANFIGLGLMIDNQVPVTTEKKRFAIELKLFFIAFWVEKYK